MTERQAKSGSTRPTLYVYQATDDATVRVLGQRQQIPVVGLNDDYALVTPPGEVFDLSGDVEALSWQHEIGAPGGRLDVTLRVRAPRTDTLLRRIVDGDWFDVALGSFGTNVHVGRGIVRFASRQVRTANQATAISHQLQGSGFGEIFDLTKIMFDTWTDGAVLGAAALAVLDRYHAVRAPVDQTVRALLFGYLEVIGERGRANWRLPASMRAHTRQPSPSMVGSQISPPRQALPAESFAANVAFVSSAFTNDPPRVNAVPFGLPDGQSVWSYAEEWSDPPVCELLSDLVRPDGRPFGTNERPQIGQAVMAVTLRDRPFPTYTRPDELWINAAIVPMHTVEHDEIEARQLGRGDDQRANAYYVAPTMFGGYAKAYGMLQMPLWNPQDILYRGIRRVTVDSRYIADLGEAPQSLVADEPLLLTTKAYRQRVRDFLCLSHLLYRGTISFRSLRPEIRIGHRIRIPPNPTGPTESYYVERVRHDWSLPRGGHTTLGVSRGFVGDDGEYMKMLSTMVSLYEEPPEAP